MPCRLTRPASKPGTGSGLGPSQFAHKLATRMCVSAGSLDRPCAKSSSSCRLMTSCTSSDSTARRQAGKAAGQKGQQGQRADYAVVHTAQTQETQQRRLPVPPNLHPPSPLRGLRLTVADELLAGLWRGGLQDLCQRRLVGLGLAALVAQLRRTAQ